MNRMRNMENKEIIICSQCLRPVAELPRIRAWDKKEKAWISKDNPQKVLKSYSTVCMTCLDKLL